jgi:hypothetical protein
VHQGGRAERVGCLCLRSFARANCLTLLVVYCSFSVDTLLWNEKLLEQRIMQLTAWTRRSPMPRRQKLERINRLVNQCNATDTKPC